MLDFSSITSVTVAENACLEGHLVRIFLFPAELGGQDRPENIVYVPPHIVEIKNNANVALLSAVHQGMIDVAVVPEYLGASFVPTKIMITAATPGVMPRYAAVIKVW